MPLNHDRLLDETLNAGSALLSDWAHVEAARALARAAGCWSGLVYLRTWPTADGLEPAPRPGDAPGHVPRDARDGWESTQDLREGLSVVEVFATGDPRQPDSPPHT